MPLSEKGNNMLHREILFVFLSYKEWNSQGALSFPQISEYKFIPKSKISQYYNPYKESDSETSCEISLLKILLTSEI